MATSGTVSTELALAGAPMVIAYKIDGLSYLLMKNLVTAKHITLFNIAADDRIAPEEIDKELRGIAVNDAAFALMTEDQVTAQGAYLDLFEGWKPTPIAAPVVLLRAAEPLRGLDAMRAARPPARRDTDLASGPGKLSQAFGITRELDGGWFGASDPVEDCLRQIRAARTDIDQRHLRPRQPGAQPGGERADHARAHHRDPVPRPRAAVPDDVERRLHVGRQHRPLRRHAGG